jgi:hypothetical protein
MIVSLPDLRTCFRGDIFTPTQQLIFLGAHNLANYKLDDGGYASLQLLPPDILLYNFETLHSDGKVHFGNTSTWRRPLDLIDLYRHYDLWEFSRSNMRHLSSSQAMKKRVSYVPLGYLPSLAPPASTLAPALGWAGSRDRVGGIDADCNRNIAGGNAKDEAEEQIDILFYGSLNVYRHQVLQRLRSEGLTVYQANAGSEHGVFGAELTRLISRSKIVLNLQSFRYRGEWKITRLLPAMEQRKLIISDKSGDPEEMAQFEPAIVFTHGLDDMVEQCRFYLNPQNSELRRKRGEKGHRMLLSEGMRESAILLPQLRLIQARRGCL